MPTLYYMSHLLQPNDPIILVKQPHNKFDPNAVSVRTIENEDVGFIPKVQTHLIKFDKTNARVVSRGKAEVCATVLLIFFTFSLFNFLFYE